MEKYMAPIILSFTLMFVACADEYKCKCLDRSQFTITQGSIPGTSFVAANIVFPQNKSSFRIVADNSAKTWDNITVKLFDNDRIYLDISDGIKFMNTKSSTVYIEIPINLVMKDGKPVLGELNYACNFFLGNNSALFTGTISMISCDNFYELFDADDCRWSCQLLDNGFSDNSCSQELCPF